MIAYFLPEITVVELTTLRRNNDKRNWRICHGGLNDKGEWIAPKKGSLFPQKPVMMVYRGKLLALLKMVMKDDNWQLAIASQLSNDPSNEYD